MDILLFLLAIVSWWISTHLFEQRTTKPAYFLISAALYLLAGGLSYPLLGYYGLLIGALYCMFMFVALWVVSPYRKHKHGHTIKQRLNELHRNFPGLNVAVALSIIFNLLQKFIF